MKKKIIIALSILVVAFIALTIPYYRDKMLFNKTESDILGILEAYSTSEKQITKHCQGTTFIYSQSDNYCEIDVSIQSNNNSTNLPDIAKDLSTKATEKRWVFLRDNTPKADVLTKKILIYQKEKMTCSVEVLLTQRTTVSVNCGGMSKYKIY